MVHNHLMYRRIVSIRSGNKQPTVVWDGDGVGATCLVGSVLGHIVAYDLITHTLKHHKTCLYCKGITKDNT